MSDETSMPAISWRPPSLPGPSASPVSGPARTASYRTADRTEALGGGFPAQRPSDEREAVLRALYDDRRDLLSKRRNNDLTAVEQDWLGEIECEIDRLEAVQDVPRGHVWRRLEQLAQRVVRMQATSQRSK